MEVVSKKRYGKSAVNSLPSGFCSTKDGLSRITFLSPRIAARSTYSLFSMFFFPACRFNCIRTWRAVNFHIQVLTCSFNWLYYLDKPTLNFEIILISCDLTMFSIPPARNYGEVIWRDMINCHIHDFHMAVNSAVLRARQQVCQSLFSL